MAVLWTWVTWGNAALFIIVFVVATLFFKYAPKRLDEYSDSDDHDEAAGK